MNILGASSASSVIDRKARPTVGRCQGWVITGGFLGDRLSAASRETLDDCAGFPCNLAFEYIGGGPSFGRCFGQLGDSRFIGGLQSHYLVFDKIRGVNVWNAGPIGQRFDEHK